MVLNIRSLFGIFQNPKKANVGIAAERGTAFTAAELTELMTKLEGDKTTTQPGFNKTFDVQTINFIRKMAYKFAPAYLRKFK